MEELIGRKGSAIEATPRLSTRDLAHEGGELLPDKEVLSLLDLFVNIDVALDLAAPVDLAVAANANVAAPIDAAASANVLSVGSTSGALAQQGVMIDQYISGEAIATATQDGVVDQSNDTVGGGGTGGETTGASVEPATTTDAGTTDATDAGTTDAATTAPAAEAGDATAGGAAAAETTAPVVAGEGTEAAVIDPVEGATTGLLDGSLVNVEVDAAIDADLVAPIAGAVAANANVAAPIDAAAAANIASVDSEATAIADQTAIINQSLDGVTAEATADQQAEVTQ